MVNYLVGNKTTQLANVVLFLLMKYWTTLFPFLLPHLILLALILLHILCLLKLFKQNSYVLPMTFDHSQSLGHGRFNQGRKRRYAIIPTHILTRNKLAAKRKLSQERWATMLNKKGTTPEKRPKVRKKRT